MLCHATVTVTYFRSELSSTFIRQLKILIGEHNLVSQQSALSKAITSSTVHLSLLPMDDMTTCLVNEYSCNVPQQLLLMATDVRPDSGTQKKQKSMNKESHHCMQSRASLKLGV